MDHEYKHPTPVGNAGAIQIISIAGLVLFCLFIISLLFFNILYMADHEISLKRTYTILCSPQVIHSMILSLKTSFISLILVLITSVPVGFALARCRFTGKSILNTVVDIPLILPPVVLGLSYLTLFGTGFGHWLEDSLVSIHLDPRDWFGIVLCQYIVAVPYCIRAMKASFDSVNRAYEDVALTLGCTPTRAFFRITLPQCRNGLLAGSIMAWARAIGVFGPLMIFIGTSEPVQVMPTAMVLEISIGNIETALVISFISIIIAGTALLAVHLLLPGRNWT